MCAKLSTAAPSMCLKTIKERLDLVEEMIQYPQLRQEIIHLLGHTFDSLRLVTKFTLGRGDADDLIELSKTIFTTAEVAGSLQEHSESRSSIPLPESQETADQQRRDCMSNLGKKFQLEKPLELAQRIQSAIDEDGLTERHQIEDEEASEVAGLAQDVLESDDSAESLTPVPKFRIRPAPKPQAIMPSFRGATDGRDDIWIVKRDASPSLQKLHSSLDSMQVEKEKLEQQLRNETGTESLVLKWTPTLAHIAHVRGKDVSRVTAHYPKSLTSSKSTRTFQVPAWTQLGARMDETRFRIRSEEQRVLSSLREDVIRNLVSLRRNASTLDELDVACAFAILAIEKDWTRPILDEGTGFHVIGGRHPVVEASLEEQAGRKFIPNDCILSSSSPSSNSERILLLTGPNMAGKSTYLRQNALLPLLAQSGSYIPASFAHLGLVDAIYSRVGSADNLYADQSTFMVEMLETAHILRSATDRSFVIMDEVGRGTASEDGEAVSYAALWHLSKLNGCRGLFATHFHGVADMVQAWEGEEGVSGGLGGKAGGVGMWCNDVTEDEETGRWWYVYKLRRGVNRESHALKVARVAGLPEEAVRVAAKVLGKSKMDGGRVDREPREVKSVAAQA